MKILFLTNSLGTGGIETNLVRLTAEFVNRGHEVYVGARGGVLSQWVSDAKGRLVPLEVKIDNPGAVRRDVVRLRRLMRETRPDVIHVFSASTGLLLRLSALPTIRVSWRRRIPVVASIMGLVNHPGEWSVKGWVRNAMTVTGAQRVLNSAPAIEASVLRLPIRRSRFVRQRVHGVETWNGTLPAREGSFRREQQISPDDLLVVTIGRLDPTKSHDLYIKAAADVLKKRKDAHFLIVGGGPLEQELRDLIAKLHVQDRVRMLGDRRDVAQILAESDVCVRPGIVEGFVGLTVLEAQALGVPVVAFETEDVKLAVRHDETGLLVPPKDIAALARAIESLLDDPERAQRIGQAGKRHLEQTFAIEAVVDGLELRYRYEMGESVDPSSIPSWV